VAETDGSHPGVNEMDNDDAPVGRFLSRRKILTLFGGAGAVWIVGAACSDDKPASTAATSTSAPAGSATTSAPTSVATAAATANTTTAVVAQCVVSPELTAGP